MKITLKYQKQEKVYNSKLTYKALCDFISKEFKLGEDDFYLTYQDDQGDQITMSGDADLITAQELNYEKESFQLNVKESESNKMQFTASDNIEKSKNTNDAAQEGLNMSKKERICIEDNQICNEEKMNCPQDQKINGRCRRGGRDSYSRHGFSKGEFTQSSSSEERGPGSNRGRKFEKIQKLIKQAVATQVDQRIKAIIPCLKAQLQGGNPIKQFSVENPLVHEGIECKGCFAVPIVGFRYKCLQCPNFNLCQKCEPNIEHAHNMLKIKKPVVDKIEEKKNQPQYEEQEFSRHHRHHGRRHHGPGFMFHHPFGFFGPPCGPWGFGPFGPRDDPFSGDDRCKFGNGDFRLIKKCHKLANIFGGEPQKYKEFAEKNIHLRRREIIDQYAKQNKIDGAILNQKLVNFKCQKIAAFFNKKPQDYKIFVQKNKDLRPRQMIRQLIDSGIELKPENGQGWGRWGQWNKCGKKFKNNDIQKNQQRKSKDEKDKSQKKDEIEDMTAEPLLTSSSREQNQKQGKIFKTFIDIFGEEQAKDYFKFIQANFKDYNQEQLIDLWIKRAN